MKNVVVSMTSLDKNVRTCYFGQETSVVKLLPMRPSDAPQYAVSQSVSQSISRSAVAGRKDTYEYNMYTS